jgi:hypothetical protein
MHTSRGTSKLSTRAWAWPPMLGKDTEATAGTQCGIGRVNSALNA